MQRDKIKPILFSIIKHTDSEELKRQLPKDVVSGVMVAVVALPLSIALAIASGVSPEQGLYTAIVAGFFIAFLGGSRVQISGPTAAFATIVAGIVATDGMDGLVAATVIAGVLLMLMGFFKLGSLIRFVPYTITTGFTAGIAVTLVIGQVKDFLGLAFPAGAPTVETMDKLQAVAQSIGTANWQAFVVGAVCLAILFAWPKVSERIPGSLVALIAGIALVSGFGMQVSTIGDLYVISSDLPEFRIPQLNVDLLADQLPNGITIAILAAIESLLSCVVADSMISSHHRSNMELVAQGVGNIGSVLFGGIPATGAIARTAANVKNGGRTPVAGMTHALVLLIVLVFFMPYAALIPMPTIAAVLLHVAYNMSGWRNFAHLCKTASRGAVATLLLTFALTVVFDLVVAIAVGMLITVVLFMKMVSEETEVRGWKYPRSWKSRFFKPDSASTIPRRSSRLSIRRQFHTCGAQPLQALVELGSLVLEHRLLSPHDGQPLVARRRAAALQLHVILDALDRQAAFPKRIDEVQLSHIRLRERADAARIARQFGKEPAFVVVANRERGDARHVGDFADAEAWQRVVGLSSVLARVHRCPFRSCLE